MHNADEATIEYIYMVTSDIPITLGPLNISLISTKLRRFNVQTNTSHSVVKTSDKN